MSDMLSVLRRRRHPSQYIAFGLLMFAGSMIFASNSLAAGGSSSSSLVKPIDSAQAVWVGLAILLGVYALIITEVVHRTLAAAIGGLLAVIALNYYAPEDTLSLVQLRRLSIGKQLDCCLE